MIECKHSLLQAPTCSAILTAVVKTIGRYYPKDVASVVSGLGYLGFEFQKMPAALQSAMISAIQSTAPKKSCWDLVQTIMGLAQMKIPSSVFQQSSLLFHLASKSNLLGPSPTAHLILGMGLLSKELVQMEEDIIALMQILSRKWSRKMTGSDFMVTCLGVCYLSGRLANISPMLSLDAIAAPFKLKSSATAVSDRKDPRVAVRVPTELRSILSAMNSTALQRCLTGLSRHGISWKLLARFPELKSQVEERIVHALVADPDAGPLLRAMVGMQAEWEDLTPSIRAQLLDAIYSKLTKATWRTSVLAEAIWCLGYLHIPVKLPESLVFQLFESVGEHEQLQLMFGLGGIGYDFDGSAGSAAQALMEAKAEEYLTTENFEYIVLALMKLNVKWPSIGPGLKQVLIEQMKAIDSRGTDFPDTVYSLHQIGAMSEFSAEMGEVLMTKISQSTDKYDARGLLLLLQALPTIRVRNAFEKLYLARRLFSNAMNCLCDEGKLSSVSAVELIAALAALFDGMGYQLSETNEDKELIELINLGLDTISAWELPTILSLLDSFKILGIKWEELTTEVRNKVQGVTMNHWSSASFQEKEKIRECLESFEAWDSSFPDERPANENFSGVLNHTGIIAIEEICAVLDSTPSHNLPELLLKCGILKLSPSALKSTGIWNAIETALIKSNGSAEVWKPAHVKTPLLLNAFEKIGVKDSDISELSKIALETLMLHSLPKAPARSVSNTMYYSARLKWPLTANIMRECRSAFFRTCKFMKGEGEFANALWAMTHMACSWINFKEKEISSLQTALMRMLEIMNARDLSTAMGALRTMRARWSHFSYDLCGAILDRTAEVVHDMDGTSIALLLFSYGEMQLKWNDIPIVARAVVQESLLKHAFAFSSKEVYWAIGGLSKLETPIMAINPALLHLLIQQISRCWSQSTLDPEGIISICRSLARLGCAWADIERALPPPAHLVINSKLMGFQQSQCLRFMESLHALGLMLSEMHPSTVELLLSGISKDEWLRRRINLLAAIETFTICEVNVNVGTEVFRHAILDCIVRGKRATGIQEFTDIFCCLPKIGFLKQHFTPKHCRILNENLGLIGRGNSTLALKTLKAAKLMSFDWSDFELTCQNALANAALKAYTVNKDNRLLLALTSMGASIASSSLQIDIHKKTLADGNLVNIKLIETLNKRLPSLTDEDLLRVIYLLGTSVQFNVIIIYTCKSKVKSAFLVTCS